MTLHNCVRIQGVAYGGSVRNVTHRLSWLRVVSLDTACMCVPEAFTKVKASSYCARIERYENTTVYR